MVRKSFLLLALFVCSFSLFAETSRTSAIHLRLVNRGIVDERAVVTCGGVPTATELAPMTVADLADAVFDRCRDANGMATFILDRPASIAAFDTRSTDEGDEQRLLTSAPRTNDCLPLAAMQAPLNGCKFGTATVAAPAVSDSTYAWSVDGATILSGAGTPIVTLSLGAGASTAVAVDITNGGCTMHGSAVIALHDPFTVRATASTGPATEPVTISWNYENGSPASQVITGTDFGPITLDASQRSYTYTPATSGSKQFTIDAALDGTSTAAPPTSRHRAVGKAIVTASACATAHATTHYDVADCAPPEITLYAPPTVIGGTTITLTIAAQAGATATWSIHNGTPTTATGNSISVAAGTTGTLDITIRLTRGSCNAELVRSIAIVDKPVCNHPTATVSAGPISCGSAIVSAVFTGTPPFNGTWSDGTPFTSFGTSLTRTVTAPGNYSIQSFQDAACSGTPTGVAAIGTLGPTATLVGKANSCIGQDSYKIVLTGKTPFSIYWADGDSLVTSQTEITKTVSSEKAASFYGYDPDGCPIHLLNNITARPAPRVYTDHTCLPPDWDNVEQISAYVDGPAPISVKWTDGVTDQQRFIHYPAQAQTYTLASASDAYCSAVIDPAIHNVKVYGDPLPDFITGVGTICMNTPHSVSLNTPPPPNATVFWSIDNGTILSGQGTSSAQYQAANEGTATLTCFFRFPEADHCPATTRRGMQVDGPADGSLVLPQPTMPAGGSTTIDVKLNPSVITWSIESSKGDQIVPASCPTGSQRTCSALYTSSHGPGLVTLTLHMTGFCGDPATASALLTINP